MFAIFKLSKSLEKRDFLNAKVRLCWKKRAMFKIRLGIFKAERKSLELLSLLHRTCCEA